jgi:hypothetical protein
MERPLDGEDHIQQFVLELMSTGSMLVGLVRDLADGLPADAYPREEPTAVVLEMMCGTIATAIGAMDPEAVRSATNLIDLAGAQVLEHLQLAYELSRRGEGDDRGLGRTYG